MRIEPRWPFDEVRRAALALARDVEQRAPALATSKWWKEERHGVFLDYNQNAKDRTIAAAYSVRARPDARVSAPLAWDEVADCNPADFTLATMPARFAAIGDPHAAMDQHPCTLDALLALADRQAADGQQDAPWPPHYRRQPNEPTRAAPSRRRKTAGALSRSAALTCADAGSVPLWRTGGQLCARSRAAADRDQGHPGDDGDRPGERRDRDSLRGWSLVISIGPASTTVSRSVQVIPP